MAGLGEDFRGAALVTGGAVRIGRAVAIALAEAGYDIALHFNSSVAEAEQTAKTIKGLGQKCEVFQCDLNDNGKMRGLIGRVYEQFSNINLLINNASIFERAGFRQTDEDIFDRHININFRAPFFLTQDFATTCKKGQIINILDTNITKVGNRYFAYLLSKKALYEFTRMAARDLGPDIKVNALAIGATELSQDIPEGYVESRREKLPLKQISSLDDITSNLQWLLRSRNVTGQTLFVDGGENLL